MQIRFFAASLLAALASGSLFAGPATAEDKPTLQAHLASYKDKGNADKGWRQLAERYSSVLYFQPQITEIDLPGKGKFLRLYAEGDEELMRSLCKSMKERKLYCALTDGDGKFLRD